MNREIEIDGYVVALADTDEATKVFVLKSSPNDKVGRKYRSIITSERKRRKYIKFARAQIAGEVL